MVCEGEWMNWRFNLEVAATGLAYDLDVGVGKRMGLGVQGKASFGICTTRYLKVLFIEIEKIERGTVLWGELSRPMF